MDTSDLALPIVNQTSSGGTKDESVTIRTTSEQPQNVKNLVAMFESNISPDKKQPKSSITSDSS